MAKQRTTPTFNPQAASPRATAPTEPQMLRVKAKVDSLTSTAGEPYDSPRVVYDMNDQLIPHEDYVTTPMTASLVLALMAGDIEEEPPPAPPPGTAFKDMKMPAEFGGRLEERDDQAEGEGQARDQAQGKPEARPPRQEGQDQRRSW